MAEIEATKTPHNPNEGDPESKISSASEERFDEKSDIHEEEQAKFKESYAPDV